MADKPKQATLKGLMESCQYYRRARGKIDLERSRQQWNIQKIFESSKSFRLVQGAEERKGARDKKETHIQWNPEDNDAQPFPVYGGSCKLLMFHS